MRHFNLKMEFRGKKVIALTVGNFGEVPERERVEKSVIREDSLISWPVNPNFTGPYGILSILGVPVHDNVKFKGFID